MTDDNNDKLKLEKKQASNRSTYARMKADPVKHQVYLARKRREDKARARIRDPELAARAKEKAMVAAKNKAEREAKAPALQARKELAAKRREAIAQTKAELAKVDMKEVSAAAREHLTQKIAARGLSHLFE